VFESLLSYGDVVSVAFPNVLSCELPQHWKRQPFLMSDEAFAITWAWTR
jgi:hypothetical protein